MNNTNNPNSGTIPPENTNTSSPQGSKKHKKIRQPVPKGLAKHVPVVMQLEMLECGAASLCMILAYYDKWITLEQARMDCGVSRDGSNARNIMIAARNYGLEAKAYRLDAEALLEEGPYPCIIHWGMNHFVVLDGFKGKKAVLNDPARGKVIVPWEEFDKNFTGICMCFEPGENFVPSGKPKSVLEYVGRQLKGTRAAVIFVLMTTIITSLMGVISPVFARIFYDRLLSGKNPGWLVPFIAALSAFTLISVLMSFINAIYSLRIQGKMAAMGNASYLWKVLRLPMVFFGQRIPADLAARQGTNAEIAATLVNKIGPLIIQVGMMIFYLILMLRYNIWLTAIGVAAILINLAVSMLISRKRVNITRVQMRDAAKLSETAISGINMIETIKASGAERGFFEKWAGYHASVNAQNVKAARIDNAIGLIPGFVSTAANLAVTGTGVYLILRGQFGIGSLMAFQGFLSSFSAPAASIISTAQTMQEMVTQMERVEDVMEYPEDSCFTRPETDEEYEKLTGSIEMEHVTFGYSRLGEPLIRDFSMSIKPGQKIAFVGSSGCGKSTLARLLSGLCQPWEGKILFDGKEIHEIDRNVFTGSLSVVDQDITLFDDTITNNITMWDESVEQFEVILAARDARIHDDILLREGGYLHRMAENGKDFSGGQRQRMEIARALAQDPTIIILDEATSALDAKTENEVVNAIADRGITTIVIAHRLSTIRDCDEIIVLNRGLVVERGTHEELYAKGGYYTQLIANE